MKIQQTPNRIPARLPRPTPAKAAGACGALAGLCVGRTLPVAAGATGGYALGQALGGTWGGVAGLAVGAVAGYYLEKKSRVGRIAGGMVGGTAGVAVGWAAGALGWQPKDQLAKETQGFSLSSLPAKLANPNYTSHHRLTPEEAAPGMALVQPGDIIITSDDEDFQLELMQKAVGASGSWTHAAIVDENKQTMDIYISTNKPVLNELGFVFGDNHHASVLRPRYASPESITKTLDYARSKFEHISYDHSFDMKSDDSQYCQEYIFKALAHGAPEIHIPTRKPLGRELVLSDDFQKSPDIDLVWSTGSSFGYNFLSKVT
ncbi:hypothetical protein ABS71_11050 [bacterium SCN 62-11]|nr:MAG: hypothetical protein ABS71_11050 [bacterium SCN 62-11]